MNDALEQRLLAGFVSEFDAAPTLVVQAPGRVNLIGEHTDYNDGFVLPCAIGFRTLVAVRPRDDMKVRVLAGDHGRTLDEFQVDQAIAHAAKPAWADYVRGVFAIFAQRGIALRGAQLAIVGDVPNGAGLSSSASLQVALGLALKHLLGRDELGPTDLALMAQQAENQFVGCQCGIMDQLISARGEAGHALLIDCRSLDTRAVPVPDGVAVMIVHSHVRRGLVDSEYNQRRLQCQAAADHLGVAALRDADLARLDAARGVLDETAWRRAQHVITENQRTLQAAAALGDGDLAGMGALMAQSHRSMRDDFQITVPAIDQLVDILQQAVGSAGGARMTGGGFGGCAVALIPEDRVDAVRRAVARHYRSPNGKPGTVHVSHAAAGASVLRGA